MEFIEWTSASELRHPSFQGLRKDKTPDECVREDAGVQARRPLRLAEPTASDSELAARTLHAMLALTDREHFAALFLNSIHRITGAHFVAVGGQQGVGTIEPRTVFRAAISACAAALIIGHNHPSGDPTPSAPDMATTSHLMAAGKLLGIPVLDHIIVTRDSRRWYSMHERGTLPSGG